MTSPFRVAGCIATETYAGYGSAFADVVAFMASAAKEIDAWNNEPVIEKYLTTAFVGAER